MSGHEKTCPNCGHCPTCGRSNRQWYWPYGTWPYRPYPYPYTTTPFTNQPYVTYSQQSGISSASGGQKFYNTSLA